MLKLRFVLIGLLSVLVMRGQVDSIFVNGNVFVYLPPSTWNLLDKNNDQSIGDNWNAIYAHPVFEKCGNATIAFRFEHYPLKNTGTPGKFRLRKPEVRAGFQDIQGHHGVFFASEMVASGCFNSPQPLYTYNVGYQFWVNDTTHLFFVLNSVCTKDEEYGMKRLLLQFCYDFFGRNERSLAVLSPYRHDTPFIAADSIPVGAGMYKYMIPEGWSTYRLYNDLQEKNETGRKLQLRTLDYDDCNGSEITLVLKSGSPLNELFGQDLQTVLANAQRLSDPEKADTIINGLAITKTISVYNSGNCRKAFTAVTQYTISPSNSKKGGWYFTITVSSNRKDLFTALKDQEAFEQFIRCFIYMNDFEKFKKGL